MPADRAMSADRTSPPAFDASFARRFAQICGAVPAVLLAWDAGAGQLGVNGVNFAIRTTGLVGLTMLTLSLAITPLRRLTGWSALIAARRPLGLYGFGYIAAHFAIFFGWDRAASIGSTLTEIATRSYLWFGTIALVAMIPLALTSSDEAVARLGARKWKRLHRLAYVASLGGVIHFYMLVKADVGTPLAFAIATGGLLLFRVGARVRDRRRPARRAAPRMWSGELTVARITDESPDVKTFRLEADGPLPFTHVAGQYLNLALTIDGATVRRSYTIASAPTLRSALEISVKRVGRASSHLHTAVRVGDRLKVSAPAGRFVFRGDEARRVVLIAGGIGITPLMSVIRALTDRAWTGDIYLAYAVRTTRDRVFGDELAALAARFPNLHVRYILSQADDTWDGARGHVSRAFLDDFVPELTRGPFLLCGPTAMMVATRALLRDAGVADADIHEEAFAPVATRAAVEADRDLADPGSGPAPDPDRACVVRFRRAGVETEVVGLTVLEAAEDAGVDIPSECRAGICGQCKTAVVEGDVYMEAHDALTRAERARGLILACQARPRGDVVIEA